MADDRAETNEQETGGDPSPSAGDSADRLPVPDPGAGSGTVATALDGAGDDGGGPDDGGTPPETAPGWPEDWRRRMAAATTGKTDGEAFEKELRRLQRFKSPEAVAQSWRALEQRLSAGATPAPPPEDDADALAEWREANGIPETPAGYYAALESGLVIGDDERPLIDAFMEAMHAQHAPPALVGAAIETYYDVRELGAARRAEQDEEARDETLAALDEAYGPRVRREVNRLNAWLSTLPADVRDLFASGRLADGTPIFSHPTLFAWMIEQAQAIAPSATVVPGADGANVASRKAEIEALMKDNASDYYRGPKAAALQDEYRQILEYEDRQKGRAG